MNLIKEWWILNSGTGKPGLLLQFIEDFETRCGEYSLIFTEIFETRCGEYSLQHTEGFNS